MSLFKAAEDKLKVKAAEEEEEEKELVDPQQQLREECTQAKCLGYQNKLNECNTRVRSRKKTEEKCSEEMIDYMHCIDQCASKTLFSKLK